jgi:hypothetical protein
MKFLKNHLLLRSRDAKPGIVDINAQSSFIAPAAHKHAPLGGVFDGI